MAWAQRAGCSSSTAKVPTLYPGGSCRTGAYSQWWFIKSACQDPGSRLQSSNGWVLVMVGPSHNLGPGCRAQSNDTLAPVMAVKVKVETQGAGLRAKVTVEQSHDLGPGTGCRGVEALVTCMARHYSIWIPESTAQ